MSTEDEDENWTLPSSHELHEVSGIGDILTVDAQTGASYTASPHVRESWDPSTGALPKSSKIVKEPPTQVQVVPMLDEEAGPEVTVDSPNRDGTMTPPPTLQEVRFLAQSGMISWDRIRSKEFWFRKKIVSEYPSALLHSNYDAR